ncbi:hypothetical protein OSC52_13400 [Clostridium pasteurianum]|nr:hypothetical protein [Clostridium pasteurianum]UZW12844.1 hypothetical protein OSC52_13400 [Clostridium pasteurianum]
MSDNMTILIVAVLGILAMTVFAMFAIKLMIDTVRSSKSNNEK